MHSLKKHPVVKNVSIDLKRAQMFGCCVGTGNKTTVFCQSVIHTPTSVVLPIHFADAIGLTLPFLNHKIILNANAQG